MREGTNLTRPQGHVRWEKKTDYPFSIQWVHSDQGVQKCCRAVKNLFTTPPSLWIWYTWWLILRENSACYCLHLASNLVVNAVFSNSNALFSLVFLCYVVFMEDQKWVEVAVCRQSLCLLLEEGESWKSWVPQITVECVDHVVSKHSSILRVGG